MKTRVSKLSRSKTLLRVLLIGIFSLFLTVNGSAQDDVTKKGYKGPIDKEGLRSQLEKVQGKANQFVEGYLIKGDDIVEILRDTNYEIMIKSSIIRGGLDFTTLPDVTSDEGKLPDSWDKKRKEQVIQQREKVRKGFYSIKEVKNKIQIIGSEIQAMRVKDRDVTVQAKKTLFYEDISFKDSIFSGDADFEGATFFGTAIFEGTAFKQEVEFDGAVFHWAEFGSAYFRRAKFSGIVRFAKTLFEGNADFQEASFKEFVGFVDCTFKRDADFYWATFNKIAYFNGTQFWGKLRLVHTEFKGFADFRDAKIRALDYNNAEVPHAVTWRCDFRRAVISNAHFEDIIFEKDVDFSDTNFGKPVGPPESTKEQEQKNDILGVLFKFVTFESDVSFIRTGFWGWTGFHRVNFKKDADFTDCSFKPEVIGKGPSFALSYLNFTNLLIKWDNLPNMRDWKRPVREEDEVQLQPLSQVIKGLEEAFRKQGKLSDANNAYYHMKREELREAREGGKFWLWLQTEAECFLWGATCGYGTKIWWIIGWAIFINLLFTILYVMKGELNRHFPPVTEEEFVFKQRLFDFPKEYFNQNSDSLINNQIVKKIINGLRFSSVVLFKVGYRDTTISGKLLGIDYKWIVRVEWVLGYCVLAALVITLSNTLPILNKLLSGVF